MVQERVGSNFKELALSVRCSVSATCAGIPQSDTTATTWPGHKHAQDG